MASRLESSGARLRSPQKLLLVDDNLVNLSILVETLEEAGHALLQATDGPSALALAREHLPVLVLLDVMMPGMDGFEVCRALKDDPLTSAIPVIFLSARSEVEGKVRALGLGAVDFIEKPFRPEEVVARVDVHLTIYRLRRELEHELRVARHLLEEAHRRIEGPLLGSSAPAQRLREDVERAAHKSSPVVIVGPPGAGDEAVARSIHERSDRRGGPFIHVHCSVVGTGGGDRLFAPDASEKGSTGGEKSDEPSRFELADRGTLFLEDVSFLRADDQRRLVEILSSATARAGADVRIVASSTRDLAEEVREGKLDPELYRLLSARPIRVPALVERIDDIRTLAEHFIKRQARRLDRRVSGLSENSVRRLESYHWPGNIQELENVIERAMAVSHGPTIEIDDALVSEGIPLDRYRLIEKIREGGMGEIWTAKHQFLARPVAVKLIRSQALEDADRRHRAMARFEREAKTTAELESPNIVRLHDFGVTESGLLYYVMELLHGIDARELVTRCGPVCVRRAVSLLRQAASALTDAHAHGIVHRDIKPANLFVCRLGAECDVLKVLDFGIVRDHASGEHTWATDGRICGTPGYIAPELISERNAAGAPADIYALGCVAWWLLTGRPVFDAASPVEVLIEHVRTPPRRLSDATTEEIPSWLDDLVHACLAKEPTSRPTASELLDTLRSRELESPWTAREAQAWWEAHAADVQSKPARKDGTTPLSSAIGDSSLELSHGTA